MLRHAVTQILTGLVGGFGFAVIGAHVVRNMWFDVSAIDPTTILGVVGVVGTVAVLSAIVPAERAARIDPATVLKES